MSHDGIPPKETPRTDDDEARTEEAKRTIKDYANLLRDMIKKLRRLPN